MKTLDQIGCEQGTDRASNAWHDYLRTYDELLTPLRHDPIILLEMGILGGAGLRMWSEYLTNPNARIVGIDIQDYHGELPYDNRLSVRYGSQSDYTFVKGLPYDYNVIIDDAGHFAADQQKSFDLMWPRVRPGGLYFIEDLHTAWSPQHCNSHLTIMQFIEQIMEEMQDHRGPDGRARTDPGDRWNAIDQITIRKGLAIFRKKR